MITIAIYNYRGCARADIGCNPIALVAGRNGAGKSSLAQGVGAALCGRTLPIAGLSRGDTGVLVKTGATSASAAVATEQGSAAIDWPAAVPRTKGDPPAASTWAAGLDSVVTLSSKERARVFGQYLKADPTRDDLATALAAVELGSEQIVVTVWEWIETHGWDGSHDLRKEKGAELKGRWRQVTGANYGSRIAAAWTPPGWRDLEFEPNEGDLFAAAVDAKEAYDKAIGDVAVSAAERKRLEGEVAKIDKAHEWLTTSEEGCTRLSGELARAQERRAALPVQDTDPTMPCPHCGAMVSLRRITLTDSILEKATILPPGELKQRRAAIAEAESVVTALMTKIGQAKSDITLAKNVLQAALDARDQLATLPEASVEGDIEALRLARDEAQNLFNGWQQKRDADDLHQRIVNNELVLGILAPDGLRAKKLAHVLGLFNSQLGHWSLTAQWKEVAIDAEMNLTYGNRRYELLSSSEQYRVRAALQLAMAKLDGSQMVVLDAADVLDGPARSGLFAMLDDAAIPALVCLTLTRREQMPDLAAAGIGASYWIESGVVRPLRQETEAA